MEIAPGAGEILMGASPVRRESLIWHNTKKLHAVGMPFLMDKSIRMDWDDNARCF
jgi:hypothetical protein